MRFVKKVAPNAKSVISTCVVFFFVCAIAEQRKPARDFWERLNWLVKDCMLHSVLELHGEIRADRCGWLQNSDAYIDKSLTEFLFPYHSRCMCNRTVWVFKIRFLCFRWYLFTTCSRRCWVFSSFNWLIQRLCLVECTQMVSPVQCPQQRNGYDCGVATVAFAYGIASAVRRHGTRVNLETMVLAARDACHINDGNDFSHWRQYLLRIVHEVERLWLQYNWNVWRALLKVNWG